MLAYGPQTKPIPDYNDLNVIYNNLQRYLVVIPSEINFPEGLYTVVDYVEVKEMWLEIDNFLEVSVKSSNGFNMVQGDPTIISSIKYTMYSDNYPCSDDDEGDFISIIYLEAGEEKWEEGYYEMRELRYEVTPEAVAGAKFAGEHKDTLTFKVDVGNN